MMPCASARIPTSSTSTTTCKSGGTRLTARTSVLGQNPPSPPPPFPSIFCPLIRRLTFAGGCKKRRFRLLGRPWLVLHFAGPAFDLRLRTFDYSSKPGLQLADQFFF